MKSTSPSIHILNNSTRKWNYFSKPTKISQHIKYSRKNSNDKKKKTSEYVGQTWSIPQQNDKQQSLNWSLRMEETSFSLSHGTLFSSEMSDKRRLCRHLGQPTQHWWGFISFSEENHNSVLPENLKTRIVRFKIMH